MDKLTPYDDLFSNWTDVQQQYRMSEPEPDEVIYAGYNNGGDYSADSIVLYRNGDKYYLNTGSHCSCYGLENQWDPEEYDLQTLIAAFAKGTTKGYYSYPAFAAAFQRMLDEADNG